MLRQNRSNFQYSPERHFDMRAFPIKDGTAARICGCQVGFPSPTPLLSFCGQAFEIIHQALSHCSLMLKSGLFYMPGFIQGRMVVLIKATQKIFPKAAHHLNRRMSSSWCKRKRRCQWCDNLLIISSVLLYAVDDILATITISEKRVIHKVAAISYIICNGHHGGRRTTEAAVAI